jgi:hypothetical protein
MNVHSAAIRLTTSSGVNIDAIAITSYLASLSPIVIQHAVWLYVRFTLSYRDVEELLGDRGLDVSYETVRSAPNSRTALRTAR